MTTEQESNDQLNNAEVKFVKAFRSKWRKGQDEHGGLLSDRIGLIREIRDETLDQYAYLWALEKQLKRVQQHMLADENHRAMQLLTKILS
jgi:hypothetical protein